MKKTDKSQNPAQKKINYTFYVEGKKYIIEAINENQARDLIQKIEKTHGKRNR